MAWLLTFTSGVLMTLVTAAFASAQSAHRSAAAGVTAVADDESEIDGASPSGASAEGAPVRCGGALELPARISLAIVSPETRPLRAMIRDEVTAVWRRNGVSLEWLDPAAVRSGDDRVLRLIVQDETVAPHAIAWIRFADGRPQTVIRASSARAEAFLARAVRRWQGSPNWEVLSRSGWIEPAVARLLAWALSHEVGHFILESSRHAAGGLMRAQFDPIDVLQARPGAVTLAPADRRRLARRGAACERGSTVRASR